MSNKLSIIAIAISAVSLVCSGLGLARGAGSGDGGSVQYVMYVGTNDKDTYKMEHTEEEARDIVDQICLKHFEGYTLQDATGAWTDDAGVATHEYSLVCYFDGAEESAVKAAADEILAALNQSAVLIEKDVIDMEYYGGN